MFSFVCVCVCVCVCGCVSPFVMGGHGCFGMVAKQAGVILIRPCFLLAEVGNPQEARMRCHHTQDTFSVEAAKHGSRLLTHSQLHRDDRQTIIYLNESMPQHS